MTARFWFLHVTKLLYLKQFFEYKKEYLYVLFFEKKISKY